MLALANPQSFLNWSSREFFGPDARDFLHRLSTVQVRGLAPGEGRLGFFLTAAGKIRAQFFLACLSEDRFFFEWDAGKDRQWSDALERTIEEFTFSERQEWAPPSSLQCLWVFSDSDEPLPRRELLKEAVVLDRSTHDFGLRWWSIWAESSVLTEWRAAQVAAHETLTWDWSELNRRRVERVRPWVDAEMTFEVSPLELGLFDGIAQNKGCYPGQEVMERVITQGAPPRRLVWIEQSGHAAAQGEVREASASQVVPTTWLGNQGLALVRKNFANLGQKLSISESCEVTVRACSPDAPFDSDLSLV
ncbi:MAG: hypothetical protein RJB38_1933 [Pseudomonadota bacterium]|jgi:folate-binding protein YgfZ